MFSFAWSEIHHIAMYEPHILISRQAHNTLHTRNSRSQFAFLPSLYTKTSKIVFDRFVAQSFALFFFHTTERSISLTCCVHVFWLFLCVIVGVMCMFWSVQFVLVCFRFWYVCVCGWVVIISRFIDLSKSHCHYCVLWSWRTTTTATTMPSNHVAMAIVNAA